MAKLRWNLPALFVQPRRRDGAGLTEERAVLAKGGGANRAINRAAPLDEAPLSQLAFSSNRTTTFIQSNSHYDDPMTEADANANLNKMVLITGANQGIGLHTALLLAKKGFDITLACRNEGRAQEAMRLIRKQNAHIKVQWMRVDLAQLDSVHEMVEQIRNQKCFFDVAILNAGVLLPSTAKTVDGHEQTFQVNFLAHFLLIDGIIAHQCPAKPIRVITLTSVMHRMCGSVIYPIEKDPSKWARMFDDARRWKAYALSKFATALLAQHLNTREGVKAFAVHPGIVKTQMADAVGHKRMRKLLFFFKWILIEPETAAENVAFCVSHDLSTNQYRQANRTHKLASSARKERNMDALVRLAHQLTAPFRARASAAPAA